MKSSKLLFSEPFIDWLTLRVKLPPQTHQAAADYANTRPQIQKWTPETGEVEWSVYARETIRSDSHQVVARVTPTEVEIHGSPSRAFGLPNNVFGLSSLNEAAEAMISFARSMLPFPLPFFSNDVWHVSRMDLTENYYVGRVSDVALLLDVLAQRRTVNNIASEEEDTAALVSKSSTTYKTKTVYWGKRSRNTKVKMYAKGPHLWYQISKAQAILDHLECFDAMDHLLRFEVTLASKWCHENKPIRGESFQDFYDRAVKAYYKQRNLIMTSVTVGSEEVEKKLRELFSSRRQKRSLLQSVFSFYALLQVGGYDKAKSIYSKDTFRNYSEILISIGVNPQDVKRIHLPKRQVLFQQVSNWDMLKEAHETNPERDL